MGRYVFPDGELIDVGEVVLAMQRAGFEVRDVESLRSTIRKHFMLGLRTCRSIGMRQSPLSDRAEHALARLHGGIGQRF